MKPLDFSRQALRLCYGCSAPYRVNHRSRETHCLACRGLVPRMFTGNRVAITSETIRKAKGG